MNAGTPSHELVDALLQGSALGGCGGLPQVIETHISWVILTGEFAYKIKKPVRFGFVDFSSLEARYRACREELRLNRRLTPELYLDVVAFHGSPREPTLDCRGPVIEYAVKMHQFPANTVLGEAPLNKLRATEFDDLALLLGEFHRGLPPATESQPWGTPDRIWAPVAESLAQLKSLLSRDPAAAQVTAIGEFLETEFQRNRPTMEKRRRTGAVRECHGDLHLGNLVRTGGRIVPFDALEFDPALRWIDVLNEVAFLVMDLDTHGRRGLGFRFLNRYLDVTGDHEGLPVLPFYLGYRALVRAKVRALNPGGLTGDVRQAVDRLLTYAGNPRSGIAPLLMLMSGVSGSGKSWLAGQIADSMPAIHVRSDVERKRLFGLGALDRTGSALEAGAYAPDVSVRIYHRLGVLTAAVLKSGFPVIVDAASLRREHRSAFIAIARSSGCRAAILACHADESAIAERIRQRSAAGHDPSEAGMDVVHRQQQTFESPSCGEADLVITADTRSPGTAGEIADRLRQLASSPA